MRISSIANLLIATFAVAEALAPAFLSRSVTTSIDRITTQDTRDSVLQVAMKPLGNFFIGTTQPQPISLEHNSFMTATPIPGTPVTAPQIPAPEPVTAPIPEVMPTPLPTPEPASPIPSPDSAPVDPVPMPIMSCSAEPVFRVVMAVCGKH
jgi:hypothetical protein